MKKYFIIELDMSNEDQLNEMDALELDNIDQAITWIQGSMESDEEYFNININCDIKILEYKQYGSELDFYAQALVCVEYETIVTNEMFQSQIYTVEDIITRNLSVISKITKRMVEE